VAAVIILAAIGAGAFFLLGADPEPQAAPSVPSTAASGTPSDLPTRAPSTARESEPESEPAPEPPSEAPSPTADGGIPPASVPPTGLGDDPALDELAQGCYDGDMQACDDLYETSEEDSQYELYGGTCAGRQDVSDADVVYCVNAFPGN
jgi:hypothetical protein